MAANTWSCKSYRKSFYRVKSCAGQESCQKVGVSKAPPPFSTDQPPVQCTTSYLVLSIQVYYLSDVGVTEFGFVINTALVITVSLHLAVETLHWVGSTFDLHSTLYPCTVVIPLDGCEPFLPVGQSLGALCLQLCVQCHRHQAANHGHSLRVPEGLLPGRVLVHDHALLGDRTIAKVL